MKNSIDILDAVSKRLGGVSDYRVAQVTGISSAVISTTRAGRRPLPPSALKLAAKVLEVEAGVLIAIVEASKSNDPEIKASLMRLASIGMSGGQPPSKKMRRAATATALLIATAGMSATSPAPAGAASAVASPASVYYVKSRATQRGGRIRWVFRGLRHNVLPRRNARTRHRAA
jgi:hypothetical protein